MDASLFGNRIERRMHRALIVAFALLSILVAPAQSHNESSIQGEGVSPAFLLEAGLPAPAAQAAPKPYLSRARQLSPSSRGTPLIISEIMYHPREPGGTENLEYIEIFNTEPVSEIMSGYRISGAVDFTFPSNTSLAGRSFVVVARDPEALRQATGMGNVIGPYAGSLPNDGGQVRLSNRAGALLLEVNYQDQMPWPVAADGAGHSLQLARPDYGEGSVEAWSASAEVGGSPGRADPEIEDPLEAVVINEFLAHTDLPQIDFIELFNRGTQTVDLSGCGLSDRADTNKFIIPAGTLLARGRLAGLFGDGPGFCSRRPGRGDFPDSGRRRPGDRCRALRRAAQRHLVGTLAGRSARHSRAGAGDARRVQQRAHPARHRHQRNHVPPDLRLGGG